MENSSSPGGSQFLQSSETFDVEDPAALDQAARKPDDESSDDDWHARTWELFVENAKRGVLTAEEFVPFARELNVETDAAMVRRFLRADNDAKITFDVALHLLEAIPIGAVDELDEQAAVEAAESNEIALGPLDYMRVACCGGAPPPEALATRPASATGELVYRVRMPAASPQFWLIFNASLVFTVVSATIISLVAIMWLNSVTAVDDFYLDRYERLISAFARSFTNNAQDVASRDLFDQADTFSLWIDRSFLLAKNDASRLEQGLVPILHGARHLTAARIEEGGAKVVEYARALDDTFQRPDIARQLSRDRIETLMRRLRDENGWESALIDPATNASVVMSDGFAMDSMAFSLHDCVAKMPTSLDTLAVFRDSTSLVDGVSSALATAVYLVRLDRVLCITQAHFRLRAAAQQAVAASFDTSNAENDEAARRLNMWSNEAVLVAFDLQDPAMPGTYVSTLRRSRRACGTASVDCDTFMTWVRACAAERCTMNTNVGVGYDGSNMTAAVSFVPELSAAVVLLIVNDWLVSVLRTESIQAINKINPLLAAETEVLMGDSSGQTVVGQATDVKYPDNCELPNCSRLMDYDALLYDAIRNEGSESALRPNSALEPVLAASSYVSQTETVFATQGPLEFSSQTVIDSLMESLDRINRDATEGTEVMLIAPEGVPRVRVFNGLEPCPTNVVCINNDTFTKFRADCAFCLPIEGVVVGRRPLYLTQLDRSRCPDCNESTLVQVRADNQLARVAVNTLETGRIEYEGRDYGGTGVLARASPIENLTAAIVAKVDKDVVRDQVLQYILLFVGIAVALIVIGLAALIFFSQQTLRRIENEWRSFKTGIEAEKLKFNEMIEQLVPGPVIERYRAKVKCVTNQHNGLSFAFVDLCGFSEKIKVWSPRQVVRTIGYFFHLYHTVGVKFDVFRLRSFGDVAVFVCGLERQGDEMQQREATAQDTMQLGRFAGYVTQLLSPAFSHFPQRLALFADSFRNEPREQPMPTIRCRIGLHNGPAHAGLVDIGKTPFYELFGPSLAITQRMQATAQPGRVNVSATFKELIETVDSGGVFEFDALKKAVVKGRGAISSYPIKTIQLAIDEVLLHQLKIEHAQRTHMFINKVQQNGAKFDASENSSQVTGLTGS